MLDGNPDLVCIALGFDLPSPGRAYDGDVHYYKAFWVNDGLL